MTIGDDRQAALAASRGRLLAAASEEANDGTALRRLADREAVLTNCLVPMPVDPAAHVAAAHVWARPYLEQLPRHDPAVTVAIGDAGHAFTPRKVLRRILDHALDHLDQIDQWLSWRQSGVVPTPADGWAGSAVTLDEDRLALTEADLAAWLWRIDLAVGMLERRTAALTAEELDWLPPHGGWTLRRMVHHVAAGERFYAVWLDEALPEEPVSRYAAANHRFGERLASALAKTAVDGDWAVFDDDELLSSPEIIADEVLAAERNLTAELSQR